MAKIPQFVNGELTMVESDPPPYKEIKLSHGESEIAVRLHKKRLKKQTLTLEELSEALRRGREAKFYRQKEKQYWQKVNNIH